MAADAERNVPCVLVVEDDEDYCHLLGEAFGATGFRTLEAENGESALRVLRAEPVDLVVSDFIMPELNGLELCRVLQGDLELSRVKVLLYSCNPDVAFRSKARELGALDYLPKTEDVGALVQAACRLAGLECPTETPASSPSVEPIDPELLRVLSAGAGQLKILFDNFMDFIQVAVPAEPSSPSAGLAWRAAQRTSGEIQRILRQMETEIERQRS